MRRKRGRRKDPKTTEENLVERQKLLYFVNNELDERLQGWLSPDPGTMNHP